MSAYIPPNIENGNEFNVEEDPSNGLLLANNYIPNEVLFKILTSCDPNDILKYSLVCRTWYNITRSDKLWATIYEKKYKCTAKKLPWYIHYCLMTTNYFDTNLLLNGNGQNGAEHWVLKRNRIYGLVIEDPPDGVDPLPLNVPEFNNYESCFGTANCTCYKMQIIEFRSRLFRYILDKYKPRICLSEWTAGKEHCDYRLRCGFRGAQLPSPIENIPIVQYSTTDDEGSARWKKIEIIIIDYPEGIEAIKFKHEAAIHGTKMAGGVVKILFDSIEPLPLDTNGLEHPTASTKVRYLTNAIML